MSWAEITEDDLDMCQACNMEQSKYCSVDSFDFLDDVPSFMGVFSHPNRCETCVVLCDQCNNPVEIKSMMKCYHKANVKPSFYYDQHGVFVVQNGCNVCYNPKDETTWTIVRGKGEVKYLKKLIR